MYTAYDIDGMVRLCEEHAIPGSSLVFAASLRMSERALDQVAAILQVRYAATM